MGHRRGEGVIALVVGLALAAAPDCDPAAALAEVLVNGTRDAYLCLSRAEAGEQLVLTKMAMDPLAEPNRLTRALVLWLLERPDRAMEPELVARLSPADRRLLADGIRARRGRASPSPEHAAVFGQLPWYAPVPGYTDARLRPVDRANIEVVDPAVRLTPPVAEEAGNAPASAAAPCGCAVGGESGFVALLLAALGLSRRRGRSDR